LDGLDVDRIALLFGQYLALAGKAKSRTGKQRMFAKPANPRLLIEMMPLLLFAPENA
tara:strand:- start:168 stop:338 length:171 start_codon:yes stop_codon:yes gene_type:complete